MKRYYCTHFDRNYLPAWLTLFRSLIKHSKEDFKLFAAGLDEKSYQILCEYDDPRLVPVSLTDIENFDPEFAAVRPTRSYVEYLFTLSPVFPRYLLAKFPEIDLLTQLDTDMMFFDDPEIAYRELGDNSVLISPHNFPPQLKWREKYGIYNLSYQIFRRDADGEKVLNWWRKKCLEWCYDRPEPERFADQKYLNYFYQQTDRLKISANPGINVGPWNWMNQNWNDEPEGLVCYHFQGAKFVTERWFCHNCGSYGFKLSKMVKEKIYLKYAGELKVSAHILKSRFPCENFPLTATVSRTGANQFRQLLSGIKHHNLLWVAAAT